MANKEFIVRKQIEQERAIEIARALIDLKERNPIFRYVFIDNIKEMLEKNDERMYKAIDSGDEVEIKSSEREFYALNWLKRYLEGLVESGTEASDHIMKNPQQT